MIWAWICQRWGQWSTKLGGASSAVALALTPFASVDSRIGFAAAGFAAAGAFLIAINTPGTK
jgi:hypothetical protein